MKKALLTHILTPAVITILMLSCSGGNRYHALLDRADSLMAEHPDSAYALLASIESADMSRQSKHLRMRYELQRAEAQNKLYTPFTTDSVLRRVVGYYDRHGSANQRLKSLYLLGCAYRDLHETPRAIECYQDAIDCADTTSADCDFKTLSCVYSQMASLLKKQLLLESEIQSLRMASKFALLAQDSSSAISFQDLVGSAYILLNKKDSAERILLSVKDQYNAKGLSQEALLSSIHLIHLYVHLPESLSKAKLLMDRFERESDLFDENHELPPSRRQYFRYKGLYYEQIGKLDSAEYYYRKIYRPGMSFTSKDPMYHGLLSVYTKLHITDSIAKYSQLYCEANDSSIAIKDREINANLAAQYNYTRHRQNAQEQEKRAAHRLIGLIVTSAAIIFLAICCFWLWLYSRRRHQYQQRELEFLREEYEATKANYLNRIASLRQTEALYNSHIQSLKDEQAADIITIKAQYEDSIHLQQEEINRLARKIQELKQEKDVKADLETATQFASSDIVKHICTQASKNQFVIKEHEWEALTKVVGQYYPQLLQELRGLPTIHFRDIRVCILTIIGLKAADIAHFIDVKENVLSKIKSRVNYALFTDRSAKTLYSNLNHRYGMFL